MAKQATSVQSINLSSLRPVSVYTQLGPITFNVAPDAVVEYEVYTHKRMNGRYGLIVWIDNQWVGWHCGEHSGEIVRFSRKSDAVRLADTRNAAWASRRSAREVV